MAIYIEFSALKGKIPEPFLTASLDDDGDGVVDAFEVVLAGVQDFIDGVLSTKYAVPFETVPKVVRSACLVLVCEECYRRREVPDDKNPHFSGAEAMRKLLQAIARGDIALQATNPTVEPVTPAASIVIEESSLGSRPGRLF